MIIFKKADDLRKYLKSNNNNNTFTTGFVPTMGALHKGHISLIKTAKQHCTIVIASIFINPTQFNDPKDFTLYPRTLEKDIYMLEKGGCDILFLPDAEELYPGGIQVNEHYDLGYLETVLEGKYRPGHFQGVCQVVSRLINIVMPNTIYLGQKDYQQCMVIKRLLTLMGSKTAVVICPTLREQDGLAMSSRNIRLNPEQREKAKGIYEAIIHIKNNIHTNAWNLVKASAEQILINNSLKSDYIEIADVNTLQILDNCGNKQPVILLIAAYMNTIRLIDNWILE